MQHLERQEQRPPRGAVELYIDADACPVKSETYRVAERHGARVWVVANSPIAAPRESWITRIRVDASPDAVDDWIAARAGPSAVVVTADILLASRCVKAGAAVVSPSGRVYDDAAIGLAVATRNLMQELRSQGESIGGLKPFSPKDRSAFLSALDRVVARLKRKGIP